MFFETVNVTHPSQIIITITVAFGHTVCFGKIRNTYTKFRLYPSINLPNTSAVMHHMWQVIKDGVLLPSKGVSCPNFDRSGTNSFWTVPLSVPLFVHKYFYIGHIFWLVRVRAFIFHMSILCDMTFLLVPS